MFEYSFKAIDIHGRIRKGKLSGPSKAAVREKLSRMRMRPLSIQASSAEAGMFGDILYRDTKGNLQVHFGSKVPTERELSVFTKQFGTMIASGVPMISAINVLADQQQNHFFGRTLKRVQTAVENGATLSDAMEVFPGTFDNLYVSLVRAGEMSGSLDVILGKLSVYIEKSAKIKAQVSAAMRYPAIVVFVAGAVVTGLLVFVVPSFAKQFTEANQQLPALTQFVIDLSNWMQANWYVIGGMLVLAVLGLQAYRRSESGLRVTDGYILKFPAIGDLLRKIAVGRFCAIMATMLGAGVSILEALKICASGAGNKAIEEFILSVRESISQGRPFAEPLGSSTLFPPMVVSMVQVGEATGQLEAMLTKVSDFYEDEVDIAVKGMISLIEPVLIVVIGGIVGFVIIAMYLPVFDMGKTIGQ